MKLSVCLASYNGEKYIRQQLESILCQLSSKDEVIVSDDSSTDNTLEIVEALRDPRIRVLAGNIFYSPVFNFEHALKQASGDIIILADQDDVWLPGKIDLVREKLGPLQTTPALIVLDGEIIDATETIIEPSIFAMKKSGPGLLRNVYDSCYIGCCMAFTRPLLALALPLPQRVPMHDWWIALLAEIFAEIEFVPVRTIRYRRHGGNTSFTSTDRLLKVRRRVYMVILLLMRSLSVKFKRHRRVL